MVGILEIVWVICGRLWRLCERAEVDGGGVDAGTGVETKHGFFFNGGDWKWWWLLP